MQVEGVTALVTLVELEASWNSCGKKVPQKETVTALLPHLFLGALHGSPTFLLKDAQSTQNFFEKIFVPEPEAQSFKLQMQKIKKLFLALNGLSLSIGESARLRCLETNLNALGRHVFSARHASLLSFLRRDTIEEFQLCYTLLMQLSPPVSAAKSLPNTDSKLCWFNATMKYLAGTSLYDKNLCQPSKDPGFESLRHKLIFLIQALRNNWDQVIIDSAHQELVSLLKSGIFSSFLGKQQDAIEFLLLLQNRLAYPHALSELAQVATIYKSFDTVIQKAGIERPPSFRLQIPATDEEEIDLQARFMQEGTVDGVKEYLFCADGMCQMSMSSDPPQMFTCKEVCFHLPHLLEIWLTRGIIHGQTEENTLASQQKIKIGPNGTLTLIEWEPIYQMIDDDTVVLVDGVPRARCKYRAVASINRHGETAGHGHFATCIRASDNTISRHSDSKISTGLSEEVWKNATLLQLECIERTLID